MMRSTVVALVALLMSAAVPVLATENPSQEKVICNLASKNCVSRVQTLEKKIKKLNTEIRKGNKQYSPEELKKLEMKLQEAQDQLDRVESTAK